MEDEEVEADLTEDTDEADEVILALDVETDATLAIGVPTAAVEEDTWELVDVLDVPDIDEDTVLPAPFKDEEEALEGAAETERDVDLSDTEVDADLIEEAEDDLEIDVVDEETDFGDTEVEVDLIEDAEDDFDATGADGSLEVLAEEVDEDLPSEVECDTDVDFRLAETELVVETEVACEEDALLGVPDTDEVADLLTALDVDDLAGAGGVELDELTEEEDLIEEVDDLAVEDATWELEIEDVEISSHSTSLPKRASLISKVAPAGKASVWIGPRKVINKGRKAKSERRVITIC
ncbi:hypothetical protein P7C73_g688, partial [Tremellales sp. Uapishka_1]